jgi:hypothetical protein
MKNTHKIGWKNVKDFWCMIFSRALGKTVYRLCHPDTPGTQEMEMLNPCAWCPSPKWKHAQDRGTFLKHSEKEHQSKSVPDMGIWDSICLRIRQDPEVTVGGFLNQKSGCMCSKCGHFGLTLRALLDHMTVKHRTNEAINWACHVIPAIRPGEGEGDDPTLKQKVDEIIARAKPKFGEWKREEMEETGRRWHRDIIVQWKQGVQEKQISRAEALFIQKDGSFPVFIKESILPMWKAWKGVSFETIQGLYEMSIQMQRMKMKQLRNIDQEMYGPRKKLEGKQLENKMKASKEARKTHQILKWTGLINDVLTWRISEIVATQVETEMNDGQPVIIRSHEKFREKKRLSLLKYMHSLRSLISPFDPDDREVVDEETMGEDDEGVIKPGGASFISEPEKVQKVCDSMFQIPKKPADMKTQEEKRREAAEKQNRKEEWTLQTLLNNAMSPEEVEDICDAV